MRHRKDQQFVGGNAHFRSVNRPRNEGGDLRALFALAVLMLAIRSALAQEVDYRDGMLKPQIGVPPTHETHIGGPWNDWVRLKYEMTDYWTGEPLAIDDKISSQPHDHRSVGCDGGSCARI